MSRETTRNFEKEWEDGLPIFTKLFEMNRTELVDALKRIVPEDYRHVLQHDPVVDKITRNDKPFKIEVSFYDSLYINPFGITYKSEHGEGKRVSSFWRGMKV